MDWTTQAGVATAWCDFNMVGPRGLLPVASADVVGLIPRIQDWLTLQDEDRNTCQGVVVEVTQTLLKVLPLWETWQPGTVAPGMRRSVVLGRYQPSAFGGQSTATEPTSSRLLSPAY